MSQIDFVLLFFRINKNISGNLNRTASEIVFRTNVIKKGIRKFSSRFSKTILWLLPKNMINKWQI